MKKTVRDNWRVVAVIHPRWTEMPIASLGFKDEWGGPLSGRVWGEPFEITVLPDSPGFKTVGDVTFPEATSGEKGCELIRKGLLQLPNVKEARIEYDQYDSCSHCGSQWEELWNKGEVSEFGQTDGLSVIGEPTCCLPAINEFRAERGIALCST